MDGSKPYISDVVTPERLATLRMSGGQVRDWAEVGERCGFEYVDVVRYAREVLPDWLLKGKGEPVQWAETGRCWRCGFHGWDKNPLTPTGRCLWCEMDLQGIDLREACQSGLMERMIEVVKAGVSDG